MIEIVVWSCVLGFSPIVLSVGSRIFATIAGLTCWTADRPLDFHTDDRVAPQFGPHRIDRAGGLGYGR